MSTSHFLEPCIFHRLILSRPPSLVNRTTRSLSGQQAEGNSRHDDGSLKIASGAKELHSIVRKSVLQLGKVLERFHFHLFEFQDRREHTL